MKAEDAIQWMKREIEYLKAAKQLNGDLENEEWSRQIEIFTLALAALQREEREKNGGHQA